MTLLRCKHRTLVELLGGESMFPAVVRDGLVKVLSEIDEREAINALSQPEHSKANFDNLIFEHLRNRLPTGFSIERKTHVSPGTRFENDFAIWGPDFAVSVEIEKGDRARLDLDIRKMEAFARQLPKPAFGVFVVPSNNRLDRNISGNPQESSFDYVVRTLRLLAPASITASSPTVKTRVQIENALDLLNLGLKPFIRREMQKLHGMDWERSAHAQNAVAVEDVQWSLKVILNHWTDVFARVLTRSERTLAHEILDERNRWAHQGTFSLDDNYRALDSMERLLRAIKATEQAGELKQQREDLLSQLSRRQEKETLIDVLVIGYFDPSAQSKRPSEILASKVQDDEFPGEQGSQQAAPASPLEIQPKPTHKPVHHTSEMHQNTEPLSLEALGKLFGNPRADFAKKSSAFRRLREILLHRIPILKEKLNPRVGYVGYRAASSDRAYIYVQPDLLVIDVRRPRTIEPMLNKAGVDIIYRHNYQGRAGWTTGIRLLHNAPIRQVELVANEIIHALSE